MLRKMAFTKGLKGDHCHKPSSMIIRMKAVEKYVRTVYMVLLKRTDQTIGHIRILGIELDLA